MKVLKGVQGSRKAAQRVIVGENKVYVHENVKKLSAEELMAKYEDISDEDLENIEDYVYDEIQYTKDEYIKILSDENDSLKENQTNLELALTEIYEGGI